MHAHSQRNLEGRGYNMTYKDRNTNSEQKYTYLKH